MRSKNVQKMIEIWMEKIENSIMRIMKKEGLENFLTILNYYHEARKKIENQKKVKK